MRKREIWRKSKEHQEKAGPRYTKEELVSKREREREEEREKSVRDRVRASKRRKSKTK